MKCDFCGIEFEKENSKKGCSGCPMNKACQKIKCPNCNYEMYPTPEFKLFEKIKKWGIEHVKAKSDKKCSKKG